MRSPLILAHRYVGLAIAAFLVVAGLSGALLAFYAELDASLRPELLRVTPRGGLLDPLSLHAHAVAQAPAGARFDDLPLRIEHGKAVEFAFEVADPVPGETAAAAHDRLYLDPYTGELLGTRKWGDPTQGLRDLMPFIYRLHYSLALPGAIGVWLMGIIALLWTLDCFNGFYLTLPGRAGRGGEGAAARKGWWARWRPAWQLRLRAGGYKLKFDLHRAGGLWLWAMLFIHAWSSVAFNLGNEVYTPVMRRVMDFSNPWAELPAVDTAPPPMDWHEALAVGRRVAREEGQRHGFTPIAEEMLLLDRRRAVFQYRVKSDRDFTERGATRIFFDVADGRVKALLLPRGQASGNTVTHWLLALHMGTVFGLPYRIFVFLIGLAVATLSVTGLVIWFRKRRARREQRLQQRSRRGEGLS